MSEGTLGGGGVNVTGRGLDVTGRGMDVTGGGVDVTGGVGIAQMTLSAFALIFLRLGNESPLETVKLIMLSSMENMFGGLVSHLEVAA